MDAYAGECLKRRVTKIANATAVLIVWRGGGNPPNFALRLTIGWPAGAFPRGCSAWRHSFLLLKELPPQHFLLRDWCHLVLAGLMRHLQPIDLGPERPCVSVWTISHRPLTSDGLSASDSCAFPLPGGLRYGWRSWPFGPWGACDSLGWRDPWPHSAYSSLMLSSSVAVVPGACCA